MIVGDNGMAGVTVRTADLLEVLKKNREGHREIFLDAQKGYREDIIKELDQMLADARAGKSLRRSVSLVEPKDHTKDYDRIIRMLEMCTKDEVFISDSEFMQYVQDDWGWKSDFVGTVSNYTGRGR